MKRAKLFKHRHNNYYTKIESGKYELIKSDSTHKDENPVSTIKSQFNRVQIKNALYCCILQSVRPL